MPFTRAQDGTTQLWLDGTVGRTIASYYKGELQFGYRTVISNDEPWESLRFVPEFSAAPTAHWNFMLGGFFISTEQDNSIHTTELRVQPGVKYNFTPFKRVQSRLNLRYEFRSLNSEGTTENSQRLRIRAEVVVPLDTRNYRSDTMWYALSDAEVFYGLDQEVDERFANRVRLRAGLGRKFSYHMYVEAIYTWQRSRNNLEDDDLSTDNIIRLRFKYYFSPRVRKPKADTTSP